MECINMVDVRHHVCFPTLIHEFSFEQSLDEQKEMIDFVKNFDAKGGYKRDILHKDIIFSAFSNYVLLVCKEVMNKYDFEYDSLEISNMWANILGHGSVHPPHTHSNNFLSGVWYLKASNFSSSIQFFDPRPQPSIFAPRRKKDTIYNSGQMQFESVVGNGLIFPSWLQHWVPQMKVRGDERISISWNVIVRGNYGEPHTLQNAYI